MNLNKIIENLEIESIKGNIDIEIDDIIYDSRKVFKNTVFVCLKGCDSDGHNFIKQAINNGAIAIVTEKDISEKDITIIKVKNTRKALAYMSSNFFENPSQKLTIIAITGTKGKTTTSLMIKSILEKSNFKVGIIGTIGVIIDNNILSIKNTTPESYEVHKYFKKMVENGCKYAVIEASSIGLERNRLDALNFDIGVFTNISSDHIGQNEHKTFDEYLNAKNLMFKKCKLGLINIDDKYYNKIIKNHTCEIKTFGINSYADYFLENIKFISKDNNIGIQFSVKSLNLNDIFVSMAGYFNAYNALASICVCNYLKIDKKFIIDGLKNIKVKGRLENIPTNKDFSIFIDYAHNALSMENILKTLKDYNPKRIVTLFGAGGNRPKIRRYEMGEVSGNLSDLSVITSDNPRFENPVDIINDIETGIKKTSGKYIKITNRKEAIEYCINNAKKEDIILLAGKGHEIYQEINGIKYPFDERQIVYELI